VAGAVEQLDFELRLQIADGVTDRRLRPREAHRGGAKAAGLGDGDEHAHLIEGQSVQNDHFLRSFRAIL
jgi:hypothetical protein